MSTMGSRLRNARESAGMSQSQLAIAIDVKSAAVISNWEKDINKPSADKLVLLCKALRMELSYLLDYYGKDQLKTSLQGQKIARAYDIAPQPTQRIVDVTLEPYMNKPSPTRIKLSEADVEASEPYAFSKPHRTRIRLPLPMQSLGAGTGEPDNGEYIEVAEVTLDLGARKADYLMRVNGDSMEPDYPNDCIVAVEAIADIDFGEVGVFAVDGEQYMKVKGREGLESINPKYSVIRITEDTSFDCLGRVVGIADDVEYIEE